ncbi:MAG TPA: 16S rRNA (cytosine(1402)-N(4))-methyltransferase RsmH, partial [Candidatus Saccharimonadales bacterium]|nr:16S rRNA (cytosine(1402)-N(4))-methyltransferase RsmH [Candidatus Saccharimonadales bacterium]
MNQQKQKHNPVLLDAVLRCLEPKKGDSYLDLTAGYGGHASAVLAATDSPRKAVLVDRDQEAAKYLQQRFGALGTEIVHSDFLAASEVLGAKKRRFDMILADLGVSSPHLENARRGFSLKTPGPLDMRMDQRQQISAEQIVNQAPEAELARIFAEYGEEPKAREIARRIIDARPISGTKQLAGIASSVWPANSRIHPATRVFLALRIAVNDELGQLEGALPVWQELLVPGGRLAVISFHSLEDRIVKRFMAEQAAGEYGRELELLTKKPITATKDEVVLNPRARSAKLRAAAKIKTNR